MSDLVEYRCSAEGCISRAQSSPGEVWWCSNHPNLGRMMEMGGPIAKPVESVAVKPVEETLEERNERIWQAIKGVAQG